MHMGSLHRGNGSLCSANSAAFCADLDLNQWKTCCSGPAVYTCLSCICRHTRTALSMYSPPYLLKEDYSSLQLRKWQPLEFLLVAPDHRAKQEFRELLKARRLPLLCLEPSNPIVPLQ